MAILSSDAKTSIHWFDNLKQNMDNDTAGIHYDFSILDSRLII